MLSHSGRSNLQLKLINDARKLLEKVKAQDNTNLSLDSSFSSFDSDYRSATTRTKKGPPSPSKFKDIVIVKKSEPTSSSPSNQQDRLMEKCDSNANLNLSYSRSERGDEYVSDIDDSDDEYCNDAKHGFVKASQCSSNSTVPGLAAASCSSSRRSFQDSQSFDKDRGDDDDDDDVDAVVVCDDEDDDEHHDHDGDVCEEHDDTKRNMMVMEGSVKEVDAVDLKKETDSNKNVSISGDESDYSRDSNSEFFNTVDTQSCGRTTHGILENLGSDGKVLECSSNEIGEDSISTEAKDDNVEDFNRRNDDKVVQPSSTETSNEDSMEENKKPAALSLANTRNGNCDSKESRSSDCHNSVSLQSYDRCSPYAENKMNTVIGTLNKSSSSVQIVRKNKRATINIVEKNLDKDKTQIQALREENQRLKEDNESLQEEMNLFDEKLACLELSLGLIESVEKAASEFNSHGGDMNLNRSNSYSSRNSDVCHQKEKPIKPVIAEIRHSRSVEEDSKNINDNKSFLSATSCQTSHSIHSQGSGSFLSAESRTMTISRSKSQDSNNSNSTSSGKVGASVSGSCETPSSNPGGHQDVAVSEEIIMLRENNEKMLYAIKALSKAIITQTRKHYHYKQKFGFTKKQVIDDNLKISQLSAEKDEVTSNFYKTRAQFLEEQDKREELSLSVQHLAKIMNDLRRKLKSEEEIKSKILERIDEHSTSGASMPLSIATSGSRRMGSSREIDATTRDSLDEILSPRSQNSFHISIGTNEDTSNIDCDKSVGNLSMELEIIKLKSKLDRRDNRIASLQKKLNSVKDYLKRVEDENNKDADV
jgi:hypothetical protein